MKITKEDLFYAPKLSFEAYSLKDGTEDWLVENGYEVLGALTLMRIEKEIGEWLNERKKNEVNSDEGMISHRQAEQERPMFYGDSEVDYE